MKLDFTVPERYLSTLKVGVAIRAKADAFPRKTFEGSITSIDSRIDPKSRSITVRAHLDNPKQMLRPGLLMRVTLLKNQRESLSILEEAILVEDNQHWVYQLTQVNEQWIANRQNIIVGARYSGRAEVLDGLGEGDYLIAHGQIKVRPLKPVRIKAMDSGKQTLRQLLESAAN